MFPKKGNFFPRGDDRESGAASYAATIATALRSELGHSHRATKTVMRWTGASERTVKHWLAGYHGPRGEYLIVLLRESEAVYEAVLAAADRRDAVGAARMLAAYGTMVEVMAIIERERVGPSKVGSMEPDQHGDLSELGTDDRKNDRNNVATDSSPEDGLNPRQRWYLEALAAGREVRAGDIRRQWGVSDKTARRDIAALKKLGMVEFVGSPRMGKHRFRR